MSEYQPPVVMTIAGFDPSGGAGILADIKAISAMGGFGVAAISSLTFQNTLGVFGATHQSREIIRRQIEPLLEDFQIAAVKTGMLPTAEVIEEVAAIIRNRRLAPLVVDPVVRSTSGFDLVDDRALAVLVEKLFRLATVVTPNAAEAERLTGIRIINLETMQQAAAAIRAMGARAVLVKGGDVMAETATDLLLDDEGARLFAAERVTSSSTHGTGCTLAAAVATLLARGHSLAGAIEQAKHYIVEAIRHAPALGHGHGPLNHFPRRNNS
ncbi:MAG TPA: bifunctional hydroxymethylpyrimidine kinase/phosphomethylpyrimidine kinase [Blastocatellia bacterium]|nr:bifunctional hydroxymethylpyrimidine kinase/phosphomethylpyrimidine kinase [Blastocatellia bacterium]